MQAAFELPSADWANVAELEAALGTWMTSSERDLAELLARLSAGTNGAYPGSPTGLRWDWSEDALRALAGEVIARSTRVLDAVAALRAGEHTFANSLGAMAENDRIAEGWAGQIGFLGHVSDSKSIRDVCTEQETVLSKFDVEQSMRVDLFESLKAFAETAEAKALTGEQARLLEFTLRDFRRNGLHLPADKRARVTEIKTRMSALGIQFSKNLGEENAKFTFTKDELKGIPEDQLARFTKSETEPEKYVLSLNYPDYFPAMELCSVSSTRQKLEYEFNRRCIDSNEPILAELIRLRAEQAALLGYPTHAHYVLETRMAKTPEKVGPFLRGLSQKLTPLMEEEMAYWKQLKAEEAKANGDADAKAEAQTIYPYDVRYFTRLSELKKYKVDDQEIKKYFPVEVVTAGLLSIYQRTLGFVFEEVKDRPASAAWHPEVQLFVVKDKADNKVRGYFFLDMFPREGKYGHAAVWGLKPGCAAGIDAKERQLPVAGCVCNFTKATKDQPSLLTHSEVVTFFHEFGHVMHQLCSEVRYSRFAGTSVERDFVEAPSQMLENWCYEEEPLTIMSGHVDDHERKMPKELIDSISASKKANAGLFNKRQCILGLFDQYIHTHPDSAERIRDVWTAINAEHWPIVPTNDTSFAAGFGHLAGGYDAQYYGYMWSEVYSADMFETRFKAEGLLNEATGLSYRREIIARGGSVDAEAMIKNFLGREPTDTAFLRSKGLEA